LYTVCTPAQASAAVSSDPRALALAQKSLVALTGGAPLTDLTLSGRVISILGSERQAGTGTFRAKTARESRIDIRLSNSTRSDVRSASNGIPTGRWVKNAGASSPYAQHNCWTDAVWFYPGLSSLSQTGNANFIFSYVGQEQHDGIPVQHIRIFRIVPGDTANLRTSQHLAGMDFYLDASSFLPLVISFQVHADNNMNTDLRTEIRFANYRAKNGLMVPFHFQRIVNGDLDVDVTVTSIVVNSGLPDTLFTLQQ
jgi:hypothetical protein